MSIIGKIPDGILSNTQPVEDIERKIMGERIRDASGKLFEEFKQLMQNQIPKKAMPETLNEKILEIINNPMDVLKIRTNKQANEIEKLVLAEMYNLLVEMYNELPTGPLDRKITEIENQLNLIK